MSAGTQAIVTFCNYAAPISVLLGSWVSSYFLLKRKTTVAYGLQDQTKPIYQQIVDFCFSKILTREWQAEERVVSVRELSTQLAVNSRTVLKAYEYLQAEGIIYPERGMGFYLSKDAVKKVMRIQKKEFFENQLADMFRSMELLGISIEEITERYNKLKKDGS